MVRTMCTLYLELPEKHPDPVLMLGFGREGIVVPTGTCVITPPAWQSSVDGSHFFSYFAQKLMDIVNSHR